MEKFDKGNQEDIEGDEKEGDEKEGDETESKFERKQYFAKVPVGYGFCTEEEIREIFGKSKNDIEIG